ncbi:FtsX-like permease family protein [Thermoleophilia bacterium SCSIO 60948]|nr:FtsX-like permease family protein [Thermoleophilia bacterium SCSIO 60948]
MLKLSYIAAELRRRRGRTVLTALGLGFGVALVILVSSVSRGLDEAQGEVLEPLTGVGTEMSVSRPLALDEAAGEGGPPSLEGLSKKEQRQIERELGGGMVDLQNLGDAGERFSTDSFASTEISFNESKLEHVEQIEGVEAVAGGLTLNLTNISGKVPEETSTSETEGGLGAPPSGTVPGGGAPDSIELDQRTVSGVDTSSPDLGLLTSGQVTKGSYFEGDGKDQAVISNSYANEEGIEIGDEVEVSNHEFEVVGLGEAAVGGTASDIYVELGQLQKLSDREGRVNNIQVNATDSSSVDAVAERIESSFSGSEVTTNSELASEVSGSLSSTKDLTGKLGTALSVVALVGAFGIAALLTLSSVNKRTRELGTLKAIGWRQGAVVRQIAGESMAQGLLGGLVGAALGIGGAAIVSALDIGLDATLASQGGGGFPPGAPGAGESTDAIATTIGLDASVSLTIVVLAVGLAVIGGLVAGAVGGLRTARLRPAEALRSIE